jgi:ribonuclease HI
MERYYAYFDGGSRGNPGPAASAFIIFCGEMGTTQSLVQKKAVFLGGHMTNNEAEYWALNHVLGSIKDYVPEDSVVTILGDSQLVINQVTGKWACYDAKLKPLLAEAHRIMQSCKMSIDYEWIPRERNHQADELVNEKLDEHEHKIKQTVTITEDSAKKHVRMVEALITLKSRASDAGKPLTRKEIIEICTKALAD